MKAINFTPATSLKKIFTISAFMLLTAIGTNASAQSTCYTDYWGNWVCNWSNSSYQTTTTTDYWGNDVTNDNRGNRMTCHTDYWGNYVCN